MNFTKWSRRQFLLTSTAVASASILGDSLLRPSTVSAATFTRMDVGNLTASSSQIVSYAKAVTAMKALPSTDPRSWAYQAAIHGTLTPCPCPTSWNTCEHGTAYFWSWHRMYLYYFEKIVRKMSGDYGWALPYWNWQLTSERTLPPMFRSTGSSLYTSNRNPSMNAGTGSLSNSTVDCSVAMADTAYSDAVLDIQGPHGNVHVTVGGWMASVPTSAQDPIFYLHHANVDRLWNIWLAQGGGRVDPLSDATWKAKTYTFFDENGHAVTMTDCDVLRAAQQLNYTYQGEPPQVNEYCLRIILPPWVWQIVAILRLPIPEVQVNSDPVTLPVNLGDKLAQVQKLAVSSERLLLVLDGVYAETQPGITYDVYMGLPAGTASSPDSPFLIGTFSLFGLGVKNEMSHGAKPATFRFAINRAVTEALRQKRNLNITIIPSGPLVGGKPSRVQSKATLHIGSITVAQQTQTARKPAK